MKISKISQLEAFLEVVRCGSMKKAADMLCVSQSTVSKAISALEADLGYKLFDRNNNRIGLNTIGQAFLPYVQRVLTELSLGESKVREIAESGPKIVNVGSAFEWFMYKGINDFNRNYAEVSVNCMTANHLELREQLLNHDIFMAITYEDMSDEKIISVPIISEDSFVLSGAELIGHGNNVSLKELQNYSFAVSAPKDAWHTTEQKFFREAGFPPRISVQGLTGKNANRLISNSSNICILPGHDAHLLARTQRRMPATDFQLYFYRLTDEFTYLTVYFTYLSDYTFQPYEKNFYDVIKDTLIDIEGRINDFIDEQYNTNK